MSSIQILTNQMLVESRGVFWFCGVVLDFFF